MIHYCTDTGWTERLFSPLARCERRKRRWAFVRSIARCQVFYPDHFSSKKIKLYVQNMKIRPA